MQELQPKYEKEGFAAGSVNAIITLIVGVGVAVMVLIFVGSLGGQTYNIAEDDINDVGGSITDEAFTSINGTAVSLAHDDIVNSTISIENATSGAGIALDGNFTIGYGAGTVTLINADYAGSLNASYDHGNLVIGDSIKGGIRNSFEALEQTGDYMPIIVLSVVITLVMALVLSMGFMGGGNIRGSAL